MPNQPTVAIKPAPGGPGLIGTAAAPSKPALTGQAFQSLAALTVELTCWAAAEPPLTSSSASAGSNCSKSNAMYWHRSLVVEMLWRVLEVWQQALVVECSLHCAWAQKFSSQYASAAAGIIGGFTERSIQHLLTASPPSSSPSASASDADETTRFAESTSVTSKRSSRSKQHHLPPLVIGPGPLPSGLVGMAALRCKALQDVQSSLAVLQACLWRLGQVLLPDNADNSSNGADGSAPPSSESSPAEPQVALLRAADLFVAGAAVLRMAPHPLRLVL